jgi:hypothetical protein
MKLTGDHNQCRGCGEFFNSTAAFDRHRTGEYEKDRRCRTTHEMIERGMAQNRDGFWVTSLNHRFLCEKPENLLADETQDS